MIYLTNYCKGEDWKVAGLVCCFHPWHLRLKAGWLAGELDMRPSLSSHVRPTDAGGLITWQTDARAMGSQDKVSRLRLLNELHCMSLPDYSLRSRWKKKKIHAYQSAAWYNRVPKYPENDHYQVIIIIISSPPLGWLFTQPRSYNLLIQQALCA